MISITRDRYFIENKIDPCPHSPHKKYTVMIKLPHNCEIVWAIHRFEITLNHSNKHCIMTCSRSMQHLFKAKIVALVSNVATTKANVLALYQLDRRYKYWHRPSTYLW